MSTAQIIFSNSFIPSIKFPHVFHALQAYVVAIYERVDTLPLGSGLAHGHSTTDQLLESPDQQAPLPSSAPAAPSQQLPGTASVPRSPPLAARASALGFSRVRPGSSTSTHAHPKSCTHDQSHGLSK